MNFNFIVNYKKNNYISNYIGGEIKSKRRALGLTGEELAKKIGVSQQQISRYERGKTNISCDTLMMFVLILEIDFIEFKKIIENIYWLNVE